MPATSYPLQIVTPEGQAFAGHVRSLVLPGADGSFGILAGHAPLLSALQPGVLEMEDDAGQSSELVIGEGFVEVLSGGTKVLTDFAEQPGQIDVARAEALRERAQQSLDQELDRSETDRIRAEASLRRALLRLKVAEHR